MGEKKLRIWPYAQTIWTKKYQAKSEPAPEKQLTPQNNRRNNYK